MLWRHSRFVGVISVFVFLDIVSVFLPGILIDGFYLGQFWSGSEFGMSALLGVVSVMLYAMAGAYRSAALARPQKFAMIRIGVLLCVWSTVLIITFGLKRSGDLSRIWIFLWMFSSAAIVCLGASILAILYRQTDVLSVLQNKYVHIQTRGGVNRGASCLEFNQPSAIVQRKVSINIEDAFLRVDEEIRAGNHIILSLLDSELSSFMSGVSKFRLAGVDVFLDVCLESSCQIGSGLEFSRLPLIHIIRRPMGDIDLAVKRLMDIALASFVIALLLPLLVFISALILLEDGRPIFFRQPRKGFRQGVFEVWKFRTMRAKDSDLGAVRQTSCDDERITKIGRFLRDSGLDELPQLFNVLQGKMSIVGPRPHALQMSVGGVPVGELVKEYANRHNIRPGITGLAQVRGFRGPVHDVVHLQSRVESDIEYIERWKPSLDLWIMFKTIGIVLGGMSLSQAREKVS